MKLRGTFIALAALATGLALAGTVAAGNGGACLEREGRQERMTEREGRRARMDQMRQRRQERECSGESCTGEEKQQRMQQRRQQGRQDK